MDESTLNQVFRIFTFDNNEVIPGARVEYMNLKRKAVCITFNEDGDEMLSDEINPNIVLVFDSLMESCHRRNKEVHIDEDDGRAWDKCYACGIKLGEEKGVAFQRDHPDEGKVPGELMFAKIAKTKMNHLQFFAQEKPTTNEHVVFFFKTRVRCYSGDYTHWMCPRCCTPYSNPITLKVPDGCSRCGSHKEQANPILCFKGFPGEILFRESIEQLDRNGKDCGEQTIVLIHKDNVICVQFHDKFYNFFKWDGVNLLTATMAERAIYGLF